MHKRTLPYSFLVNDATLPLDNPLCFARKTIKNNRDN